MRGTLHAGAGRARIRYPAATWPLEGFIGEHDPLHARVVLVDATERIALLLVEQTSLAPAPLEEARDIVAAETDTPRDSVIVCVTHTFSAPHLTTAEAALEGAAPGMPHAHDAVMAAAARAAREAAESMRPAVIRRSRGMCDVNVNRDVATTAGWALGADETGPSDKELLALTLDDERGEPIAILVNYAVQPAVMADSTDGDGGRRTTGDLAGAAMRFVEQHFGDDAVACFLPGAAGDQAPALSAVRRLPRLDGSTGRTDAGPAAHVVATLLGERLGAAVVRAAASPEEGRHDTAVSLTRGAVTVPGQQPLPREQFTPRLRHEFSATDPHTVPFWLLRLGEAAFVGVQPELSAATGRAIKARSPWSWTAVVTLWNGGAKYLPDDSAYDRLTYAAQTSRFARGSAELLTDAIRSHCGALA